MAKLGTKVDMKSTTQGSPPIVMAVQAASYIRLEKPEQLKQWEEDLYNFYGIKASMSQMAGAASESCSGGCSDDCDLC